MLGSPEPVDEQSLRQIYAAIALHALLTRADLNPVPHVGHRAVEIANEVVAGLKEAIP